jgi:hypothetical protein
VPARPPRSQYHTRPRGCGSAASQRSKRRPERREGLKRCGRTGLACGGLRPRPTQSTSQRGCFNRKRRDGSGISRLPIPPTAAAVKLDRCFVTRVFCLFYCVAAASCASLSVLLACRSRDRAWPTAGSGCVVPSYRQRHRRDPSLYRAVPRHRAAIFCRRGDVGGPRPRGAGNADLDRRGPGASAGGAALP